MVTLTQLAASTAPCQFAVIATDVNGSPYDPASDPVTVTYWPLTIPEIPFSPAAATWYPAGWNTSSDGTTWVTFTPGDAALPPGAYTVIAKITDPSAVPFLPGCRLILS